MVQTEVSYGARTDVGARRELNEDAVLAAPPLFLVADGMGGHAAGEVAAAIAVQQLAVLVKVQGLQLRDIADAVAQANKSILAEEAADQSKAGMGTTVTGICLGLIAGTPHWFVFNIGDSRVYRYADGQLAQVTQDHSEVAELISAGELTDEQARTHPLRSVITRSLGTSPAPVADMWVLPVVEGERFLLCSDGLPTEVTDVGIATVLGRGLPSQLTADTLVQDAVAAGGRDNVSVIIVDVPASGNPHDVDVATAPRSKIASR